MNWSDLYPELLVLISKRIVNVFDFVYFRATCRSWRYATMVKDNTSHVPWIRPIDNHFSSLFFYRFSSRNFSKIKIARFLNDGRVKGRSYWQGYLLAVDYTRSISSLINPLTNREITLPPLVNTEVALNLLGIESDNNGVPKFVAVHTHNFTNSSISIYCCHVGDKKWTVVYNGYYTHFCVWKYYKSKFFLHSRSEIRVYRAKANSLVINKFPVPRSSSRKDSYFDFCVGEHGVLGFVHTLYPSFHNICFEVYRLENENGTPQWIKTTNIGNQIICLTPNDSCQILKVDNLSVFQGNSVYFISTNWETCKSYLHKFDIEKGTVEDLQCPIDGYRWFLPSLV